MKSKSVLRTSIATLTALALATPLLQAATIDTFSGAGNSPGSPYVLGGPYTPAPFVDGTNTVLRLLDGQNSENVHYAYETTDAGAFDTINAMFDFRITPGTAGLADGFSFSLVPTSTFASGDGPNILAEEPNFAGMFGVGFDVYPGINNIRTHWNGAAAADANPAPTVSFRDNAVYNRAMITLQRVGNGTNASVTLIPDSLGTAPGAPFKLMEVALNMLPYENRVMFAGRTGGENLTLDLDNVNVAYTNPYAGNLPAAPTGHLYQDFDRAGATGYKAVQVNPTSFDAGTGLTTYRPGPILKAAETGTSGAFMRVVSDAVAGENNRIVFDRAADGGASNQTEILKFDLRFNSADANPADGLGLVFLATKDPAVGLGGTGIPSSEEPSHPGMLSLGFDVYNNGGTDVAPGVTLFWSGTKLADVAVPAGANLSQFNQVQVIREPAQNEGNNGLNVSVVITPDINGVPGAPVTLIDKLFIAGANNYDYRVQFSGRTGGANADHDIDNIQSSQIVKAAQATTKANFSALNDSGWKGYVFGSGLAPEVRNDQSQNGNYLRIIHDGVNDNRNAVAFDKQVDGSIAGRTGINAQVDFRMTSTDASADGFSFMLIPTATYGDTGPGAASSIVAEEPNAPGVFGIGFDLYDNINEVSAHWNGLAISEIAVDPALVNLDSGSFHRMSLELRQVGPDTLLDVILTPDVFGLAGTPQRIIDDLLIPAMNLYDYRLEIAARTGGLNVSVDVDNILAQTIPEPASAALLGLGTVLLAGRRRRRA